MFTSVLREEHPSSYVTRPNLLSYKPKESDNDWHDSLEDLTRVQANPRHAVGKRSKQPRTSNLSTQSMSGAVDNPMFVPSPSVGLGSLRMPKARPRLGPISDDELPTKHVSDHDLMLARLRLIHSEAEFQRSASDSLDTTGHSEDDPVGRESSALSNEPPLPRFTPHLDLKLDKLAAKEEIRRRESSVGLVVHHRGMPVQKSASAADGGTPGTSISRSEAQPYATGDLDDSESEACSIATPFATFNSEESMTDDAARRTTPTWLRCSRTLPRRHSAAPSTWPPRSNSCASSRPPCISRPWL